MNSENQPPLGRSSTAFALAATVTVLFNTALACVKDAYNPLNVFMTSLTGHHWTTHAAADILLFLALGVGLSKSGIGEKINPNRLIHFLAGAVIVAGFGLVGWYLVY